MQGDEARLLLGFPPNSRPTPSQVKAAYRKKVWESHPDLFPVHEKPAAESKFKLFMLLATYQMVEEMAPLRSTGYVDPGWEHGIAQDDRKKKVKCNYCGKVVSGGIFRLKQHLARLSGEVTHCEKVPEEVCLNMRKNLEGCRSGRKRRQSEYEQAALNFQSNEYNDMEEASTGYKHKGKKVMGDKNLVIKFAPLRSLGYVDPGWEHCIAQDEKKKRVKCNYCEKIISGGINRFKQHLARIPGEVAYCEKAPEEVYLKIKENMKWHRTGRRHRKPETKEISAFYLHSDNEDEEGGEEDGYLQCISKDVLAIDDKASDSDIRNSVRGRSPGSSGNGGEPLLKRSRLDSVFLKSLKSQTSAHYKQTRVKTGFEKKSRREVISAICKFFYHAGIPSDAANSPYFHKMLELVGQYGQGLQGPSSRLISGRFLQEEIANIKEYLAEFKASWAITGCSIMADCWNDTQGRTLINFLVSCPRGVYFLSSVDATDMIEDAASLFKLLDKAVDEVGEEYVVQYVKRSLEPVGEVLEKIGSDEIRSMPFIYNDMCRTKLAIKAIHGDDVRKYGPFWSVIDNNWSSLFHHPLYVAAYFLNPSYRYRPDFLMNPEVIRGLNECIVRLEADNGKRISASMQIPDFVSAKADFGTDLAISTRSELDPEKQAMQEDEEIIYNEMEQFYGDDIDEHESEEKRPTEMVTLAGLVEPLDVNPAGGVTTDDDGLDFLDDDLTD
ncbi:hypothetical protein COLO4_23146 [Corchorus olitorius]|uniref:Zinc finger, BED-type n=1 Tax=Corchorus olitorius TaxID=93759 RepID=A0A1R3II32_9ROSI|nr:hypothetical protein COLO4_23146 [Corchorus olitorius]